jgi:hypothetical protein
MLGPATGPHRHDELFAITTFKTNPPLKTNITFLSEKGVMPVEVIVGSYLKA